MGEHVGPARGRDSDSERERELPSNAMRRDKTVTELRYMLCYFGIPRPRLLPHRDGPTGRPTPMYTSRRLAPPLLRQRLWPAPPARVVGARRCTQVRILG